MRLVLSVARAPRVVLALCCLVEQGLSRELALTLHGHYVFSSASILFRALAVLGYAGSGRSDEGRRYTKYTYIRTIRLIIASDEAA
jgi:hypothetical protein